MKTPPRTMQLLSIGMRILAAVTLIAYVLAVANILSSGLIPIKYLLIIVPFTTIGIFVVVHGLLNKKLSTFKKTLTILFAVLVMAISVYIISFYISLGSFFKGIQADATPTETYSIIAEKDRNISLTSAKTAGLLASDPALENVKKGLKTKTDAMAVGKQNTTDVMNSLETDATDTAVFNGAYMQLIEDNYSQFYNNIEVLATFEVEIKNEVSTKAVDASKPFILYISGIDTYGDVSSVSRSDVNILAVVNPKEHRILLVNTPRDFYVQLHGTTGAKDKLTHAGLYGIDMSRQTLEDLYGTSIDYHMRVNFSSLVSIVDSLGGVEVNSDVAFKSFRKGFNSLNGTQALAFSRERYSFEDGDRQRGRNQQRVIEAIVSKMSKPSSLVNYQSILRSLQPAIQTNVSNELITKLTNRQLDTMSRWNVESISVDGAGSTATTYSMGGAPLYVMVPDEQTVLDAKAKIKDYTTVK